MSTQTSDDQTGDDRTNKDTDTTRHDYDAVIVGGGAAGLSAALMLARARRRVLVVDSRAPRNAKAGHMHGYLSRDGMSPLELLMVGRDEVLSYGGVVVTDYVEKAERDADGFRLSLASGCVATGRHLLVATGLTDVLPEIPGMRELWARDVHVCPYCHGWEVRDQALATVATGPFSTHHTLLLRQWTDDLVYFLNGQPLEDADREKLTARGVRIEERPVHRLTTRDDGGLSAIELADGTLIPREGVFLVPRFEANGTLLDTLGCEKDPETGWTQTGVGGRTSVPGVWAAGNVVDPSAGVIAAAGAASFTGAQINAALVEADVEAAVAAGRG